MVARVTHGLGLVRGSDPGLPMELISLSVSYKEIGNSCARNRY